MRRAIALAALLVTSPALAWEILTPASDPCHERLMLGAFDAIDAPWSSPGDPSLEALLADLVERAEAQGVPGDRVTVAFVDDVAERYHFDEADGALRWVLASLVAGVRQPDTRGFAVIKLNETREIHVDDDNQADHSLRRSDHDGPAGILAAVRDARDGLVDRLHSAHALWTGAEAPIDDARWSFPYYGELEVEVFGPAYRLAQMGHTVQDAFTHTLRDEHLRIVTVLNFVDAIQGHLKESRDGIAHSGRLDHCDVSSDDFDRARFAAARRATIDVMLAAHVALGETEAPEGALDAVLDRVYSVRPGCTVKNDYCGTPWLEPAREEPTVPIRAWFCDAAAAQAGPGSLTVLALLGLWRRRARRGGGARRAR